jgi:hypothetical protein
MCCPRRAREAERKIVDNPIGSGSFLFPFNLLRKILFNNICIDLTHGHICEEGSHATVVNSLQQEY